MRYFPVTGWFHDSDQCVDVTANADCPSPSTGKSCVHKTVDVTSLPQGDTFTFTLTVENDTMAGITSFQLTDTLPSGLTYDGTQTVNAPCTNSTFNQSGQILTWTFDLPVGDICEITFEATGNSPGTHCNEARLRYFPTTGWYHDTDQCVVVTGGGDINIDKIALTPVVDRDTAGQYLITLTSTYSTDETVTVLDLIPTGFIYTGTIGGQGPNPDCIVGNPPSTGGTGPITLNFNDVIVPANSSCQILIEVFVPAANFPGLGPVDCPTQLEQNQAFVIWNSGNNSDVDDDAATNCIDINGVTATITKVGVPNSGYPGQVIDYTLEITNQSPSPLTAIDVVDILGPELIFLGQTGGTCPTTVASTVNNPGGTTTVTWNDFNLAAGPGTSCTITYQAQVDVTFTGPFEACNPTNTTTSNFVVLRDQTNTTVDDDDECIVVTDPPTGDVTIVKSGSTSWIIGSQLTYTLALNSTYPVPVPIEVTDILPSPFTFNSML